MSQSPARMRRAAVATFKLVVVVGAALLLLPAVGCAPPVSQDVLGQLPAAQARELHVYSTQHAYVFDPRVHSMETCPFLTYLPQVTSVRHDTPEFARWLHGFYSKKHDEERHIWWCTCDRKLSAPLESDFTTGE